ncbi:hypothetical protein AB0O57_29660 [Streptomyces sp. NPDC091201]|uniref:hypothetical protein n=1 Tax=Streptomyces sp. NPDC091201 TaxID=3155190 RepID=UPI00343305FC
MSHTAPSDRGPAQEGPDWSLMPRSAFDHDVPLALVDVDAVRRPVLAVPDAYGTEALFGEEPPAARPTRPVRPARMPEREPDMLF